MPGFISTGFDALDTLLGGQGIPLGSTVLLRGAAGTGKTTLALQIVRKAIASGSHSVVYVLFEERGPSSLEQITRSYWDAPLKDYIAATDRWWVVNGMHEFESIFEPEGIAWERGEKELRRQHLTNLIKGKPELAEEADELVEQELRDIPKERYKELVQKELERIGLDELLAEFWGKLFPKDARDPIIVVLDSLNAFAHASQIRFRDLDERQVVLLILRSFEGWRQEYERNPTVLLTAEAITAERSDAVESYVADIVIELDREQQVRGIDASGRRSAEWDEDLLLCRVRKGRGLPVQRRHCCYEFVPARGVVFYPTYAAQGIISLFHENRPQKAVIDTLRTIDGPSLYPGVVVQDFTRSALQQASAVRRYAQSVPPRHPLLLSNIDEYWVADLGRNDLLEPIPKDMLHLYSARKSGDDDQGAIIEEISTKTVHKGRVLYLSEDRSRYLAVPEMGNVGIFTCRRESLEEIVEGEPRFDLPVTWEDVERKCRRCKERQRPHFLRLETHTYDTLVATALELGWSHGSFWYTESVNEDSREPMAGQLRICSENDGWFQHFCRAIERLQKWIHEYGIVPKNSTVDPRDHTRDDWAFARHWYSTWVDVLTSGDKKTLTPSVIGQRSGNIVVTKIPVAKAYQERMQNEPKHTSCWGEWYLAIQHGSENVELGIELINNLMTSRKVGERALSGAGLPMQKQFYDDYGEVICFGTGLTFNKVRQEFFADARSRTKFFGYRIVARILYGALRAVIDNPQARVPDLLKKAFRAIDPDIRLD